MTELPVDHGQAPRRLHLRLQLGISAQLETLDGRQRVDLIDLSQGGAHVILGKESDCHEAVLTWLHFETFGTVVWHDGRDIGRQRETDQALAGAASHVEDAARGRWNGGKDASWIARRSRDLELALVIGAPLRHSCQY